MAKKAVRHGACGFRAKKARRARFITFEGIEGSGKSSVIASAMRYLKKRGYTVAVFREPGSTKIGEKIRDVLLDKKNAKISPHTELLLYLAARTQLIEEKLTKALDKFDFILCDRFFDSTLVYQGYGLKLGKIVEKAVMLFHLGVVPDSTIVLSTDVTRSLARLKTKDRIESRPVSFHRSLQKGYRELARKYPERIHLLAAEKDLKEVQRDVERILDSACSRKKKR